LFTLIIEDKHGGIADEYSFEEGEFYVGRSHTSDIILPSDNVSRRHARLYTVDGRCYIEDLNSSNGVFVNGRRIHEVYQIQRSAQVKIGDYYLHIESDAEHGQDEEKTFCKLVGRNLAFTNQVFRLQRKVSLIGRGKDCGVTIIDPSVSRIHAKLTVERSGALTLEDLKSSNGTFVNDDRIEVATLGDGDLVRFGNVEFLVDVPGAMAQPAPAPMAAPVRSVRAPSRPAMAVGGERRHATVGMASYEDEWAPPRRRNNLWLALWIVGGVVVLSGILLAIFHESIFKSSEPARPPEIIAPGPSEAEEQARRERERIQQEILSLEEVGEDRMRAKQWDAALEAWRQVRELDILHERAQQAINQITDYKLDKERLDSARALRNDLKRGQAARLLREVPDTSVYFQEAQSELTQLVAAKSTMLLTADNRLRQRDCEGALEQLREVQQIDPRDETILGRIQEVEKRLGTRRCR